ncbi:MULTISPECIES: DUF898 family protein [Ensifer]|nr:MULTISPECIES: DUF898 family protein [Ensifer]KSV67781.1 hypothetical protein N182_06035 [Sinorhizobium sp. GL2]KSV76390.1 hypothetical protein N185_14635 [Sinorhizobium sp. GW3]ANK71468.1 hypothetical protein FA04_01750 [Ensifer adhaerens]KDP71934.1 membrane protein [Ensifer adhaerens]KQX04447.1 hypothetical protein ASD01_16255 [Ensifer sp. Root423]
MVVAEATSFQAAPTRDVSIDFHRFSFMGSGKEYFGIWIVNVFLTIVTLGIYSAWAKVRRNRYFYGNTVLLGRTFEYHAKGKQILIGRVIVFGYLILYNLLLTFVPIVGIALLLLSLFFVPWLAARGLRFSARVTSYRNVRFDFVGTMGGAFKAFILGGFLSIITLGLLTPLASRWVGRYVGSNLRFGGRAFETNPPFGPLYRGMFLGVGLALVLGVVVFAILMGTLRASPSLLQSLNDPRWGWVGLGAGYVASMSFYAVIALFYSAAVRNAVWGATVFDGKHRFLSGLSRGRYTWIAISNFVVTILTLGLLRPWAAVRMARYKWTLTGVTVFGAVGTLMSEIEAEASAVGAEFMDFEGFDFGF